MARGKWHGNTDHCTSPSCYYYEAYNGKEFHKEALTNVVSKLRELAEIRDANGDKVVQIIFEWLDSPIRPVMAYRFTSDWASRKYSGVLLDLGGHIGRGVFKPFNEDYTFWFGNK